ncbi:ribonuclease T2 [Microcaecilia unicolor]|uniref:Ribonuclease T2-like n=1 Tax=Microcaecilia unicolor TaxID=1415580 RepID=A0A6P7XNR2_9AMPH|nr:ribonuclease T2-like [Microcaecilia unicolor]XP_030052281.1 ribonuclease T2-like [Microcaecilia unicolor]
MKCLVVPVLLFGCLCLAFCYGYANQRIFASSKHEWNKLILTHHWPVTVCKMNNNPCKDPPTFWTLHGLWPGREEMCNKSWPFKLNEIEDLLPEMFHLWPDVLHPNCSRLWKHEWQKHGTCAAELECMNSEHKYFSKTLELYKKYDLNSALLKFGIVPSTSYYQMKDIEAAIMNAYGVMPKIQCLPPDHGKSTQILGQIEICFTKEIELRNCSEGESESRHFLKDTPGGLQRKDFCVCNNTCRHIIPPVDQIWN